jgi:tetratricopeptide (TPR) repeat protein
MSKKLFILFLAGIITGASCLYAQQPAQPAPGKTAPAASARPGGEPMLSLHLYPGMDLPLGSSSDLFKPGASCGLSAELTILPGSGLFVCADLNYGYSPLKAVPTLYFLAGEAGLGLYLNIVPRVSFKTFLGGGYYFSSFNDPESVGVEGPTSSSNPCLSGGGGLYVMLTSLLNLGVGATYRNYLGLYSDVSLFLDTGFFLKGRQTREAAIKAARRSRLDLLGGPRAPEAGEGLAVEAIEIESIFPVFHNYYDDHPIGRIVLRNQEKTAATDVSVSLFIKEYMAAPKQCPAVARMEAGEERTIDLFALFSEAVLEVTEGTKAAVEITLDYNIGDAGYREVRTETVRMYYRNAMTWDDDRKAVAFVTAKDPGVMSFSKNVVGLLRGQYSSQLNENLLKALGIHEALRLYGLNYVVDPKTPYAEYSRDGSQVDYLQFPRETLDYRAGDCDDLSILYCALLESVAVETAFITVPDHIYIAVSTDLSQEEARRSFQMAEDLIIAGDRAWIPLEVTEREGGFMKAWLTGAQEWRRYAPAGQAKLYSLHEAWQAYEPVRFTGGEKEIALPPQDVFLAIFEKEVSRFVEREISPQVALLEKQIRDSNGDPRYVNRLGVLYARYGIGDKAQREFMRVLTERQYFPAIVNLGNLYYLEGEWQSALDFYQKAAALEPENPAVLLALSKIHHELENYGLVKINYEKLAVLDPGLAEKYGYLALRGEEGLRAAEAGRAKEAVEWVQ